MRVHWHGERGPSLYRGNNQTGGLFHMEESSIDYVARERAVQLGLSSPTRTTESSILVGL
ncbi:unnamed protein product [Prunus armeniaca]